MFRSCPHWYFTYIFVYIRTLKNCMSALYIQLPMNPNAIILNCEWKHMSMCRGLWGPNVMQWKKAFLTITSDLSVIYTTFLKHAHSLTHISHTTPYTSLRSRGAKRPSENINKPMWADNPVSLHMCLLSLPTSHWFYRCS